VAQSSALNVEKEGIFTASSVVRAGEAVKRHNFDLNRRCTFIADAKFAVGQGVGGFRAGRGPGWVSSGAHGSDIRARLGEWIPYVRSVSEPLF
jgi:hypothetical protein